MKRINHVGRLIALILSCISLVRMCLAAAVVLDVAETTYRETTGLEKIAWLVGVAVILHMAVFGVKDSSQPKEKIAWYLFASGFVLYLPYSFLKGRVSDVFEFGASALFASIFLLSFFLFVMGGRKAEQCSR